MIGELRSFKENAAPLGFGVGRGYPFAVVVWYGIIPCHRWTGSSHDRGMFQTCVKPEARIRNSPIITIACMCEKALPKPMSRSTVAPYLL